MKLQKIITGLVIVVALIGGVLWVTMNSGIDSVMESAGVAEAKDLVKFPEENPELFEAATAEISPLYMFTIVIGVILLAVTLISVVNGLIKKGGSIKRVILGIVLFAAILLVAYFSATDADESFKLGLYEYDDVLATEGESKIAGAGIIAFYVLTAIAIGAMLLSGAKKIINK